MVSTLRLRGHGLGQRGPGVGARTVRVATHHVSVTVRRYRCRGCGHVWRQDTSKAADARAKVSRAGLAWALTGLVVQHLTVARVAEALGVAWNTANDAVLAEGKRVLIADPARFDGVAVVGVDEHVVRHEALLFRMEVRDRHRLAVAAAG